jgi:hypothetical protein
MRSGFAENPAITTLDVTAARRINPNFIGGTGGGC